MFTTFKVGAPGVGLGAGVTELLAGLVQPFTVWVTVRAVVEVTVRGLPVPPSLQVSVLPATKLVAVTVELSQLFTTPSTGAAGVGLGAGVMELLAGLIQPFTVCLTVSAVVDVTVRGLPEPPSLQVSVLPATRLVAVTVELSQLLTTPSTGAAGVGLGAGVTELLAGLVQPFTVWVTVRAVVEVTVRGLPVPPSLQVSVLPATKLVAVTVELSQLFTTPSVGAAGREVGWPTVAEVVVVQPRASVTVTL
ncbi:hypothetical protein AM218_09080 [Hymenobacter sp. DG25A]|nr:hypothetical protein AM218_09080 [Hymenobacter sp. DG25A]